MAKRRQAISILDLIGKSKHTTKEIPSKEGDAETDELDSMARLIEEANAHVERMTNPRALRDFEEAFECLGDPATIGRTLWEDWKANPEAILLVLDFSRWVKFCCEGRRGIIELGFRTYGRSRGSDSDPHPEERGELDILNAAVEDVVRSIRNAIAIHQASSIAIYHHGIANAWPHMNAVLAELKEGQVETCMNLTCRKRGRKPERVFPMREG